LRIQTIGHRVFHTDIVTDGYVAPNGGFSHSDVHTPLAHNLPVLAGQATDLLQAEGDLVTANAQYRAAETNEKRQHALFESDGAAQKDWQQAQVDLATASAALASARNRLRILGKTEAEMASMANVGHDGAVFSVSDISTVWLVANVRETDSALVHIGDDVDVTLPAFPSDSFHARVAYISSLIDPNTHRLVIGAQIRNPDRRLKPNMAASFTIHGGQASDSPAVPQNAVVYEGDVARVWVAGARGALALRRVTIGRSNGGYAEVTSGLSAGEQIVTSGALFINQATGQD
jgi:cobalt-zinc-cadmium efflux system membrane fusion protein